MRPKDVPNPVTQRNYQLIVHKALRPSEGLPLPDWRVLQPLRPDAALFGAAKTALDAFALACPTAAQPREEKKRAWGKRGDAAAAAAGGAGGAGGGEPAAKQMRTAEHGAAEVAAGATLALKASRVEAIDSGRRAAGWDRILQHHPATPSCNPILQPHPATPSAGGSKPTPTRACGRPVEAFWAMVRDEESDRLAEALEQMEAVSRTPATLGLGLGAARDGARWQPLGTPPAALHAHAHTYNIHATCPRARACAQVLISLLSSAPSHEDAQALKGFACLRELRRAAVQEEEPAAFNACLRRLKEQYMGGGAGAAASRTPFWAAIVNDAGLQPGLITADETEESEVSAAEAAAFFATDMGATQDGAVAAPAGTQDDDDEYGALD